MHLNSYVSTRKRMMTSPNLSVGKITLPGMLLFQYSTLLDTAEENLVQITSVMVMTKVEEGQMETFNIKDTISFTILKSLGRNLPFHYQTTYGSVTLPYWETFQDKNKNKMLAFCVR